MKFKISEETAHKAKIPHEILLTNLIGNHILWFVASLGIAGSYWQPLMLVPIVSFATLTYILWRSKRSAERDEWFVMCHWKICAARSRLFIYFLALGVVIALMGWLSYTYFGMEKVAVLALTGGIGILPVLVTVLVLILMESDALHQASLHQLSERVVEKYPYPDDVKVLENDSSKSGD
jgi:hypothetical protein